VTYLTVGYPSLKRTVELTYLLSTWGTDIIELGIPFSDPVADGATIQKASSKALKLGVTPSACLEVAQSIRQKVGIPLLFMTYYNPIFSFGLAKFCQECQARKVNGIIVPDLPPEEGEELEGLTSRYGLSLVYLLAPTSSEERIELIAQRSQGFIYLVSLTGVTGARNSLPEYVEQFVSKVRAKTTKPLYVGFGISSSSEAQRVAKVADGIIVGSRILELAEDEGRLKNFVLSLREALDSL
jgi:tryptophan synthase alpha chain